MGDRDERPLLQRRGGRRISVPSSPISPSILKRNDKFARSSEPPSTADASPEPPVIDLTIPSPVFDGPTFGSIPGGNNEGHQQKSVHTSVIEDLNQRKSLEQADNPRIMSTSGRFYESRQLQPLRPTYLSDLTTKSSPLIGRTSESREKAFETTVSAGRNVSTTSLSTDRSASDENVSTRTPATKKSRLNLLNPMSLLARRRSSQNTKLEEMNINVSPLHVPAIPDNFDPSIRGNFVHDFSTPRNKRSQFDNSPRRETFSSPANLRRPSDLSSPALPHGSSPSPALHSPMFREHFQDDDRSLQPSQTAYLHNITDSRKQFEAPTPAALPSFAQKLPAILPELGSISKREPRQTLHIEIPHPDVPPPPPPKRTPSPNLDLLLPTTLPKHMTSVSSRFSFQIAGQDSSDQEKLLEEKHKEHFAKEVSKPDNGHQPLDNDYDDYDFDADDDFEERIPGVNTDFEDDGGFDTEDVTVRNIDVLSSQQLPSLPPPSLQGFHFTPTSLAFSPLSPNQGSEPTPRDNQGFPIGVADTMYSPISSMSGQKPSQSNDDTIPPLFFEGLRISTGEEFQIPHPEATPPPDNSQATFDDLDLYFDDGEFDVNDLDPDDHFDESLLDEGSAQIRDIPAENAKKYEAAVERSAPGGRITVLEPALTGLSRDTSSSSNFVNVRGGSNSDFSISRDQELSQGLTGHTSVLTEDNLAAYHDALAEAANYAAASGKFNRQVSFRSDLSEEKENIPTTNRQISSASRNSHSLNDLDSENMEDYDTFPFDDDGGDDDLMIAEANAEALENDDDGFYGQEFGFYARAHGREGSDLVNGGFFTAHGSNGIKRSHSGKANFQEPSLTPITERSEWSTRNSVASLHFPGGVGSAQQSYQSPGLSQMLDTPSFEDEMSLSVLMKLRRGAFGGSSTSVNSLGERSMPGSSPLAHISSYSFQQPDTSHALKQNAAKPASIMESEEDDDDAEGEQLTLTQNTPRKKIPGVTATNPYHSGTHLTVTESPKAARVSHHRRNSSGADSVSYVRDKDGFWVLEKRRTAEDGAQEIIEREYLVGARI